MMYRMHEIEHNTDFCAIAASLFERYVNEGCFRPDTNATIIPIEEYVRKVCEHNGERREELVKGLVKAVEILYKTLETKVDKIWKDKWA